MSVQTLDDEMNVAAVVAQSPSDGGLPDGATVDAEGNAGSAGVYKSKIHRFARDGTKVLAIDMPMVCLLLAGNPC